MADEKKFSAQEAAFAVLKKAEELYAKSDLAKAETGHEKGIHKPVGQVGLTQGVSAAGIAFQGGKAAHKLGMKDYGDKRIEASKDSHKKVLDEMKAMPKPNLGKSELAKAGPVSEPIGKFTAGKDMKAGAPNKELMGMSDQGASLRGEGGKPNMAGAKREAKQSLAAQQAMPKPNLPMDKSQTGETSIKGHIKLAKFLGRMEHKKGQKAAPAAPAADAPAAPAAEKPGMPG